MILFSRFVQGTLYISCDDLELLLHTYIHIGKEEEVSLITYLQLVISC